MKKVIILLILFSSINLLNAAKLRMTLDDCIKYAQKNSPNASIAFNNFLSRGLHYKGFRASLYPKLSLQGSIPGLTRQISEIKNTTGSVFYQESQSYSSAELNLSQVIPWTGGSISLSSGLNRIDMLENSDYHLWRTNPLQFRLYQPIFRVNNYSWEMDIEDIRYEYSQNKYSEEMEDLALNVINKFFETYQALMNVQNAETNVHTNDTLYILSQGRYNVGKIAENDLLQSELALLKVKNELDRSNIDFNKSFEELKMLLGIEPKIEIELIAPNDFPKCTVDEKIALREALNNNSLISDLKIQKINAERNVTSAKLSNGFNAALSLSFGYNQSSKNLPEAYNNLLNQQGLNLTFEMPLFQWGISTAVIESAEAALRSNELSYNQQLDKIAIDIKYLAKRFEYLQKQVILSAKADTIAQRRFEVSKNRYIIGKIDLNSFFIAQDEKDSAFLNYIQTLRNYWVAFYDLRKSTLYDFERNKKIVYEIKD